MVDDSDYEFSDNEIDDTRHEKVIENVLGLNKIQNVKKPARTEPAQVVSEFNLIKAASNKKGLVHTDELTKAIKNYKTKGITKKLKYTHIKSNTLPTPLEKPQADQIRRTVNYEKSRLVLDRWEAFVESNRAASQLVFPLDSVEKVKIEEKRAEIFPSTWRVKSDLQKELEKLEKSTEQPKPAEDTELTFALTYNELKEKRQQAAKLRIHQSYKEAKARKQNKIKSKKYHRILKKEKIKQKLKEFEELQKTNPEEAIKKLEEIDKARAEERFSLRHKGTGQWAKNKQVRAKYDKESRQVLAQQLALSRELTQKVRSADSDSEEETDKNTAVSSQVGKDNIWVNDIKPNKEVADFVSGYRQYWNEQNKNLATEQNEKSDKEDNVVDKNDKVLKVEPEKTGNTLKIRGQRKLTRKATNKSLEQNEVEHTETVIFNDNIETVNNIEKGSKKLKLNKKETKSKGVKRKIGKNDSISTSEWEVTTESGPTDLQDGDIEDIFDKLESSIKKKAKQKYKQIKKKAKQLNKTNTSSAKKVKTKYIPDLSMPSQSKKQIIDEELQEQSSRLNENGMDTVIQEINNLNNIANSKTSKTNSNTEQSTDLNPENFANVQQTLLNTALPDFSNTDENEESSSRNAILEEAFNDDDILKDFQQEKSDAVESDKPKDIDLSLPGWGQWGGTNIKVSKRKKKRFMIKAPPQMPRKDKNKGSLIINEKAQDKIKPLLVSEVPFPFKTVQDYEAIIRAPIGNTFVPETAVKKLTEPAVITKMGSIIEPVTKSMLMGRKYS